MKNEIHRRIFFAIAVLLWLEKRDLYKESVAGIKRSSNLCCKYGKEEKLKNGSEISPWN